MPKSVAERLRAAREAAGYSTAAEAAKAMNVNYQTYFAHESGGRRMRTEVIQRYARFFRTSVSSLIGEKHASGVAKSDEREQALSMSHLAELFFAANEGVLLGKGLPKDQVEDIRRLIREALDEHLEASSPETEIEVRRTFAQWLARKSRRPIFPGND